MAKKLFYILERHNPQLGVYYVAKGKLFKKEAAAYSNAGYGSNYMRSFETEEKYLQEIENLIAQGHRVR